MARFDWYQATVGASIPDIRACLADMVGQPRWELQKKGKQGYGYEELLQGADGTAARLWYGGTHSFPHVVLAGGDSHEGASMLRQAFPECQKVTRVDVCIDYADPGAYDRLQDMALRVAREDRIKVGTAGDHLVTKKGRTVYLGATSSHTQLRIYEKAEQLRVKFANDPVRLATVPAELARLECQVMPHGAAAGYLASKAEPMALMGSARWMRHLMALVAEVDLEPFQAGKVWRQADDDRAYAALLAQYGGLLRRRQVDHGSWECLGKQIGDDLLVRDKARF